MNCVQCGGIAEKGVLETYNYKSLGIPVTLKQAALEWKCKDCGEVYIEIPDEENLKYAAAVARVMDETKLNGDDIRFFRKLVGLNSKRMAAILEISPETLSRWEHNQQPIGPTSEKYIRLAVGVSYSDEAPGVKFDTQSIVRMKIRSVRNPDEQPKMVFCRLPIVEHRKHKLGYSDCIDNIAA